MQTLKNAITHLKTIRTAQEAEYITYIQERYHGLANRFDALDLLTTLEPSTPDEATLFEQGVLRGLQMAIERLHLLKK